MGNRFAHVKVAAAAAAVLLLAGCSSGTGYADLDREPSAEDAAPADLPDYALESMDASTLRLVEVLNDRRVYLAEGTDEPVCVLVYNDDTDWMSSCGSNMMTIGSDTFEIMVVDDDMPDRDGWTRAGRNIIVKDR